MGPTKPFHRTYRPVKDGRNSSYSSWAYIEDPEYALDPGHYIRAFELIVSDLREIFEFVEPSDESMSVYSYRIHSLFMRTCIEIEANFKAIFAENIPPTLNNRQQLKITHYRKIDVTHHLSSFEVSLPIWRGQQGKWIPFGPWKAMRGQVSNAGVPLPWYQAYNDSKHDRHEQFKKANFENLMSAVTGLLVLISSQFRDRDFSAGASSLQLEGNDSHDGEPCIGSIFRIKYPDDWVDDEKYDFDWSDLKKQNDRFDKIDYNKIPS